MPELPPVTRATLPSSEKSESRKPWSERGPGANERPGARSEAAAARQRLKRRLLVEPGDEEPGTEGITAAGAVYDVLDHLGRGPDGIGAAVREQGTVGPKLHDDLRIPGGQHACGLRRVIAAGEHGGLRLVDEQQGGAV